MIKIINISLVIFAIVFLFQGCGEEGSTINSNNNTGNQAPNQPSNPNPPDSTEDLDTTSIVVLSWQCSDPNAGDTIKYDLYISNLLPLPSTPIVSDLHNPSFGLGIVSSGTQYYWKVIAKDNHGATRSSNIWRFKTRVR